MILSKSIKYLKSAAIEIEKYFMAEQQLHINSKEWVVFKLLLHRNIAHIHYINAQ